ncbi:Claudin domain-containing protein 1 [Halotydeus destructor]|nr:Claudin domain-containing protein 1 [Halotydeus destructor]
MACSAVSLSLATILSVMCVACLSIAFSTDNWYEIRVDRNKTATRLLVAEAGDQLPEAFETDIRFFSRDEGLFRTCLLDRKPRGLDTYISPTQTDCINVNYYIPEDEVSDSFSDTRWERLHMARAVVASFIVAFFFLFLSFFTGIAGCWKRSHANLVATGVLQLLACLLDAGAMGLYHAVQFYDHHKLKDELSHAAWPEVLKSGTVESYFGWSYYLAWTGVGLSALASLIFLAAARCIRREKREEQAKNMQYLMPVYPDKRNPYGYAYAYPGPYAYHGSQYGAGPYAY